MMNSSPKNIEGFNLICLALFSKLYASFPARIEIDVLSLAREAIPDTSPYEEVWNALSTPGDIVMFLSEEGFLRCDEGGGSLFGNVRLTLKGLAILGYVPSSLKPSDPREPLIDKIKRVLAGGAEKAGTEAVKSVISEVFRLALLSGASIGSAIV